MQAYVAGPQKPTGDGLPELRFRTDACRRASGLFQQAAVVPHHQVTIDLLHQVECDADRDE